MEYKVYSNKRKKRNKRNKKEVYVNIQKEEINSNILISRLVKEIFGI